MLNKDKRSLLLSLVLGDGCLHYIKNNGKLYGGITIDHGIEQADYQSWKAQLLSSIFQKEVKVRTGHKGKSVQISVCMKRLRAWRKFCYPNNKKSIPKILKFIRHPELALSVLLMDDGYVETNGDRKGGRLRIFLCDHSKEELNFFIEWINNNFKVKCSIYYQKDNKKNKSYPYLKINSENSLLLWEKLREFILQFKSMKHKFRFMEQYYQYKILQRVPTDKKVDDIVHKITKS